MIRAIRKMWHWLLHEAIKEIYVVTEVPTTISREYVLGAFFSLEDAVERIRKISKVATIVIEPLEHERNMWFAGGFNITKIRTNFFHYAPWTSLEGGKVKEWLGQRLR